MSDIAIKSHMPFSYKYNRLFNRITYYKVEQWPRQSLKSNSVKIVIIIENQSIVFNNLSTIKNNIE